MQCNNCKASFEDEQELREHIQQERAVESRLAWDDPRYRILLALTGVDHGVVMPDVSRRAMRR